MRDVTPESDAWWAAAVGVQLCAAFVIMMTLPSQVSIGNTLYLAIVAALATPTFAATANGVARRGHEACARFAAIAALLPFGYGVLGLAVS